MTAAADATGDAPARDAIVRDDDAVLVDRGPAGRYHRLRVRAPHIARTARPGQFVSVGVGARHTLLRRPFAVADADPADGTVALVVADVGVGSGWLVRRAPGATLDLVGPLGRPFSPPPPSARCVLVGGGYGTAALEWLARRLAGRGHRVELVHGAATAAALYPVGHAIALVVETTEDGSRGLTGRVTDALPARLADGPAATVYACGPMPMLAAVADVAAARGGPCEVAVEEHMACGVGVCMTCVIPATAGGYVRACIDGPAIDAARVDWGAVLRRG